MPLGTWLLENHPFFAELRRQLLAVLETHDIKDLDELVVASRRPVRTVLLGLAELIDSGEVEVGSKIVAGAKKDVATPPAVPVRHWMASRGDGWDEIFSRYLQAASKREVPSLLWGQRRLIPESAVERAHYILSWLEKSDGKIVFLGEDDLVSPLVAAAAPAAAVHVIDIDRGVLNTVQETARALDARVHTHHADLSQAVLEHRADCHLVVSDPWPSGDGSFEGVFWSHVAGILRPGGISISTVSPSHKPLGYEAGALKQLRVLGLCLLDLQADFGRYESFDFEFTPYETNILNRYGLKSNIHHTKSIVAARKISANGFSSEASAPALDFNRWSAAAMGHYLTIQAGVDDQRQLAAERGVSAPPAPDSEEAQRGLRIELILPPELRDRTAQIATLSRERQIDAWGALLAEAGVNPTGDELTELVGLSQSGEIKQDGPLARLGLAIRAIESWERWRLDV
jgi:predicted methyltransferase